MSFCRKGLSGLTILGLSASVALSGCSGGTPAAVTPEAAKTEAPKQTVQLKFTYWGSPIEKKAVEESIRNFEKKYPYIKVDPQHIPADYPTKITAMMAGNEVPDVGMLAPNQAFPWAEEGKLMNLEDFMKDDPDLKVNDFLPQSLYSWAPGKTYGWTIQTYGLFYNEDILKTAGVETPPTKAEQAWTWEKFVETAKKLTIDQSGKNASEPGFDPTKIKQYGVQFDLSTNGWFSMVQSNGGDYLSPDGKKFGLTDPKAFEAIQKVADLINVHHVAPSPVQAKNIPATAVALQTKQIAMAVAGQWNLLDFGTANFKFGAGVLPKLDKSTTIISGSPAVMFSSTKHPKEAWLLIKNVRNPDMNIELYEKGLWMPYTKAWYTDPKLTAKWAEGNAAHPPSYKDAIMHQAMNNGKQSPTFYVKNFGKLEALINPALDEVWLGKKSAEQAMKDLEPKVLNEIKGRYDSK